jgi:hypothetical protein
MGCMAVIISEYTKAGLRKTIKRESQKRGVSVKKIAEVKLSPGYGAVLFVCEGSRETLSPARKKHAMAVFKRWFGIK